MTDVPRTRIEVPYANGRKIGHFILEDAERFEEAVYGEYNLSVNTRTATDRQTVYLTRGGQWVVCVFSTLSTHSPRYHFIRPDEAKEWLLLNKYDSVAAAHFDAEPEESGPYFHGGRQVLVSLGSLSGRVDAFAEKMYSNPERRSEAVCALVRIGFDAVGIEE